MSELPLLDDVIAYQNELVINQFMKQYPDKSAADARQIFQDFLSWLWLSESRLQRNLLSHMIEPLNILDAMWHVFILHTRAYSDFCQQYFGRYLHHEVEHEDSAAVMTTEDLTEYLNDCYDCLGQEWLVRNFNC
ncbi:MAG TPA: hypothetical protein VL360_01040 [Gammaproteobacteria bacterium]|jgi:hypothetical protein|nr:hypothetical protein [Gammaproteobacteria bacterium]